MRPISCMQSLSNHRYTQIIKLLKSYADSKNLKPAKTLHAQLITTNQTNNTTLTNSLINLYSKCNHFSIARHLFDKMPDKNVVSWGALMGGYSNAGMYIEVFGLFKDMLREGLSVNEYLVSMVFSSCAGFRRGVEGRQCHGYVVKSGFVYHQYVKNGLVYLYLRCCDADEAMRVMDSVPGFDVALYNSVMNGLLECGWFGEAVGVLRRMVGDEGVEWDSVSYVTVIGLCARVKDLRLGLGVHCQMLVSGVEFDLVVSSSLVDMYGKCGKVFEAKKVFDAMRKRNVVSWTSLMTACLQNGNFEEALKFNQEMVMEGVLPNEYTFAVLLNSVAGLSAFRPGDLLHAQTEKSGFKNHVIVGNALINMYSKSGQIEDAYKVFSDMLYRDIITWNAMISGYSQHGLGMEASTVFQNMLTVKEQPNYVTFVGVLSACSHLGLVEEGLYYLNQLMKQFRVEPGVEHYTCIIGLLSKAGQFDKALEYTRCIPVKWDTIAWRTLLNACHVHRNYGLGMKIAEHVMQMDPHDIGTYALLSNMYAKAKRWDGVAKIRKLMRDRNIKKEPGISWIEIKNATHVFVSEDNHHPESNQIYEKVGAMLTKIKELGYVPNIASVLHDVEDEQKADYLSYHSEKLAVAYGLMKTPSEAPIRVIKNLRMCDDCHSAIKLISRITQRVIVIRDANRFHRFQEGICSCADYW